MSLLLLRVDDDDDDNDDDGIAASINDSASKALRSYSVTLLLLSTGTD
jgi:hypothetical protein